jgi:hypothetical protein
MDLTRDHRLSHPCLRPHSRVDAHFGWPAVPVNDRRGVHRDGVIWAPDHVDRLQTPRTVGLVFLMVLPGVLDRTPRRRIAARKGSRPPGRVHRSVACESAPARARILPAKGSTAIHDPVKVPTAATFLEFRSSKVKAAVNIAVIFAAFYFAWRRWACNSLVEYPPDVVAS